MEKYRVVVSVHKIIDKKSMKEIGRDAFNYEDLAECFEMSDKSILDMSCREIISKYEESKSKK